MTRLLTPLELQVMNLLWQKERVFIKDLLEAWPADKEGKKPAYNTISTIVRILEKDKGFIGYKAYGRTHEYFPLISKADYQKAFLKNAIDNVFSGSVTNLVSALVDEEKVDQGELDELKRLLDE
ncbi:MAG: BlaI/MecI/CopY family transcriptional regulator [Aureispira sp.]